MNDLRWEAQAIHTQIDDDLYENNGYKDSDDDLKGLSICVLLVLLLVEIAQKKPYNFSILLKTPF